MSEPLPLEVLEAEAESELLPAVRTPTTLFRTDDPTVALARMAEMAKEIVDVIDSQRLYARISGKKYVTCPGWKTVGGMLGLAPYTVWTRPNEAGDGYVARVEIRTMDERTIACAEAECARDESVWENRPKHSLRAMAETRATSRAFRGPLEMILTLAGYESTAAEEMPAAGEPRSARTDGGPIPAEVQPTAEQFAEMRALLATLEQLDPETDWPARCREIIGVPGEMMTGTQGAMLIRRLQELATEGLEAD